MSEATQLQLSIVTSQRNAALDAVAALGAQVEMAKKVISANAEKIASLEKKLAEFEASRVIAPEQVERVKPRVVATASLGTTSEAPITIGTSTMNGTTD